MITDQNRQDAEYVIKCPCLPDAKRAAFDVLQGIATAEQIELVTKVSNAFSDTYEDMY
jgi:hypothetical protein